MDFTITYNRQQQILRLEVEPYYGFAAFRRWPAKFFPRSSAGEIDILSRDQQFEEPPFPRLAETLSDYKAFACLAAFALKAKRFDDRLVAQIEGILQRGSPSLPGRQALIKALFQFLNTSRGQDDSLKEALVLLGAACSLTETLSIEDRNLRLLVLKKIKKMDDDPFRFEPLGIYSATKELAAIFRQTRLLQTELSPAVAQVLKEALRAQPTLADAYLRHLQFSARFTNPLVHRGVLPASGEYEPGIPISVFPPSDSPEGRLVKRLLGDRPIPEGFSLVKELIRRVAGGEMSLQPADGSGWYDHQLFALEPLLKPEQMPEGQRLVFGERYLQELQALFQALFGYTRETHLKQLESLRAGAAPSLIIFPDLSVEPLAEYYRRRSDAYRFVRELLLETFSKEVLETSSVSQEPLLEGLLWMESFFAGAYLLACQQIGLPSAPPYDAESRQGLTDLATVRRWIAGLKEDEDLAADDRCMVPLFFDRGRNKTKALLILGYRANQLNVSFERRPEVTIQDPGGNYVDQSRPMIPTGPHSRPLYIRWSSESHTIACPVSVECYVDRVIPREEFRQLCDQHVVPSQIVAAVPGQEPTAN